MATTKIWGIKGRLDNVIAYAENSEKTDGSKYIKEDLQCLQDVMAYATNPDKTEQRIFVTGVNVTPTNARYKMLQTKRQYGKTDGITAFHGYQSFKPDEVTPATAHEIGVKLAEQLWGDRFEIVVATHLDKHHIHNHFVLNSVSFADGKKYYDSKATYRQMRETSDRLCREYGLSVIENPTNRGKNYAGWRAEHTGKPTIRGQVKAELDRIIANSVTSNEFWRQLERHGYIVKRRGWKYKYTSIIPPFGKKTIRLDSLGTEYTEDGIKQRIIAARYGIKPLSLPKKIYNVHGDLSKVKKTKLTGFKALYFHYLYLFKKIRKRQAPLRVTAFMREELIKIERYQKQFHFLCENNIETAEQLMRCQRTAEQDIAELIDERKGLYNRQGDNGSSDRIQEINIKLKNLRRTVCMCKNISADAERIRQKYEQSKYLEREQTVKKKNHSRYR
ncbi:MAG: relaxase/mobilization nuclease domain-containing protein [Oscillospiraceae bacterium]|nr:relaxase/mobilization nuclease domain-containing protein [Oscillospiraceae bacterium]